MRTHCRYSQPVCQAKKLLNRSERSFRAEKARDH
jgi:hypothetical protein